MDLHDDHERDAWTPPAIIGTRAWINAARHTLKAANKPTPISRHPLPQARDDEAAA